MNQSRPLITITGFILSAGLIIGLVWGNYQFAKKEISGEGFLIQWISIHSLVTEGVSPYDEATTDQIREAVKFENSFVKWTSPKYTSPLYSAIVVLPFALIQDDTIAHTAWLTVQLVALFAILLLALNLSTWKPAWYIFLFFSLITVFSYHVLLPWLDGGLSLWAAFFLIVTLISIRNNWSEVSGIFLALAAIQPQMTILVIIFTLMWAASHKKRMLVLWFFMTLILLSILGIFLVPDWIMQYLRLIYSFTKNYPPGNPAALFTDLWPGVGKQLGLVVTVISGLLLIIEGWYAGKKDYRHFVWTACLILVISQWIGIPVIPANFTGLILPTILVSAMLTERWPKGGQWAAVALALVIFAWEWVLFYFDFTGNRPAMQMNLLIPLPLLLVIGLYWIRWWVIKPKRMLLEELRAGETY